MTSDNRNSRLAQKGIDLEQSMYKYRSRYLILFLTLNYKVDCRDDITIKDLCEHRNRLFKNMECNSLLRGIKAYIWKIEEGDKTGLHIHLLIFYDGRSREDITIARSIGNYWVDVATRGLGTYWNSNADKTECRRRGWPIGVGQIDRKDDEEREGIRSIIRYLGKTSQGIENRPRHLRVFGMSELL
jgi:hypothetical protein